MKRGISQQILVKSRGLLKTTSKTYTQIIGESRRNG
jgi:hypothetical protein